MQDDIRALIGELKKLIRQEAGRGVPRGVWEQLVEDLARRTVRAMRPGTAAIRGREDAYYLVQEIAETLEAVIRQGHVSPHSAEAALRDIQRSLQWLPLRASDLEYLYERLGRVLLGRGGRMMTAPVEDMGDILEAERLEVLESIEAVQLSDADHVLYFVGAGASSPPPSGIPTVKDLLPELWNKSNRMETRPLEKLQTWCRDNKIENIEEMLTAVTISRMIIEKPTVHGLLNSVLYAESRRADKMSMRDIDAVLLLETQLNTFFSLLVGTMLQAKPNPIHLSIAAHAKESHSVHIMTTNYDSCIDQALDQEGVSYDYVFDGVDEESSVSLVKMHGSINWFHCETCQRVFVPTVDTLVNALEQDIPYPVMGMCKHCSLPVQQLLIPPMAYKYMTSPPVVQVWDYGRRILEQATVLVIVGYSFAAADDYIVKMLVNAVGRTPEKRVVVVDRDQQAIEKCRSLMGLHVESFDEATQFFPLWGDGVDVVPDLIGRLKSAAGGAKKKARKPPDTKQKEPAARSSNG